LLGSESETILWEWEVSSGGVKRLLEEFVSESAIHEGEERDGSEGV